MNISCRGGTAAAIAQKTVRLWSSDVAGAFWTLAPAALAPLQWRALAYVAAFALGTGHGSAPLMIGAHFPTDVIFAGVFTYLIVWIAYAFICRWPRTRCRMMMSIGRLVA